MRVLFATWDMNGHLNPMVPLAWAMRAAGHEVTVVSNPGMVPNAVGAGLPAYGAGSDFDSYAALREQLKARNWRPTTPQRPANTPAPDEDAERTRRRRLMGFRVAVESAEAQADDAVAFARWWRPDLVVFEPAAFVGPLIARLLGIPAVRHLWSVDFTAPIAEMEDALTGALAARSGLDRLGVNGDITLDPAPARLQVDDGRVRERIRYVPYNGPAEVPAWVLAEPPRRRVAVSWGTSRALLGFDHLMQAPLVVDALAEVDAEVVVAVVDSQRELFGTLPDNVRFVGRVPLHPLLRTCSALVQQGGAGGTMTALVNGVPQVVVPQMPDEMFHGWQVERSGGGVMLEGATATAESVRAAVLTVLEDQRYAESAREQRDDILAAPSLSQVTARLQQLATGSVGVHQ
ncbi:nucleotide disphospho-sugar-binding domain-containing protein [Actinoplanes sp. TFC3]|uniref:nucleotide disphospho-sugar-binding domain-containing protein n=1 Tax=Actinoplanes sp. TFC3 TaxID=1710355 RepID=UPI0009E7D916|nr:nucleotide disphospho-sugar-binding domain-containing protein [Actinoplanes sp. TFC3]